nr:unnamed protein product [Callosobruchus analis]
MEFFGSPSAMRVEQRRQAKGYSKVIHPFSKMNYFMEALFFVAWMIQLVFVPLYLCIFLEAHGVFSSAFYYIVAALQAIPFAAFFYTGTYYYCKNCAALCIA